FTLRHVLNRPQDAHAHPGHHGSQSADLGRVSFLGANDVDVALFGQCWPWGEQHHAGSPSGCGESSGQKAATGGRTIGWKHDGSLDDQEIYTRKREGCYHAPEG